MEADVPPDCQPIVAFVAGATGYVGQETVRQLAAAGVRTIAHVRPDSPRLEDWHRRFRALGAEPDATPWTLPALAATMRRLAPSRVFCLVGTTRSRMHALGRAGKDPAAASYEAVDYGLTALLAKAAVQSGTSPRFVYLSAVGAGPGAKGAYMRWRTRAEQAVQDSGMPYTIVRPAMITGPDRPENRAGERIANALVDGVLGLSRTMGLAGPWRRYRSIDAAGLARAMILLASDPAMRNRIVERGDLPDGTGLP